MNPKKVLFFNAKREKCDSSSPHSGLAMLAAVLKKRGHRILVVDYQFEHTAPKPEYFIKEFRPDIIGITLYTPTMKEAEKIIEVSSKFEIPLMVGGPHASLYAEELACDKRLDYIVKGEAEDVIAELIDNAPCLSESKIVQGNPADVQKLPYPDFTSFYKYENITIYPLLTSRGCPHSCNFCAVHLVSTRKWRPRKPQDCIQELIEAKQKLLNLTSITVQDDNPSLLKDNLKTFLKLYLEKNIGLPLTVINTRADGLDEEIIILLKKVGCPFIGLGVETGDPEVFKLVKKGETLETIKNTAELIKNHKVPLAICFIIGLPGDSLQKHRASIKLAKDLKADHVHWNMVTPFKGTEAREYFIQHGTFLRDVINSTSYIDGDFICPEPCVETPEFSAEARKKAYYMAILETNDTRLRLRYIPRLLPYVFKYKLYKEFFSWLPKQTRQDIKSSIILAKEGARIYKEKGPKEFIRRTRFYFKKEYD